MTKLESKKCRDCGEVKSLSEYYKKDKKKYFSNCKKCYILIQMAARKAAHKRNYDHRRINKGLRGKAKLLAFWQSIPAAIKDSKYFEKVKNVKMTEKDQTLLPRLLEAKNLNDVADILGVDVTTVRRWQKTNFVKRHTDKFDSWNNVMRFRKDVDYAFTQKVIQHADAARVKLWKQLYEGYVERSSNVNEFDENNIISIQKKLREFGKTPESRQLKEPEKLSKYINATSGDYEDIGSDDGGFGKGEGDC